MNVLKCNCPAVIGWKRSRWLTDRASGGGGIAVANAREPSGVMRITAPITSTRTSSNWGPAMTDDELGVLYLPWVGVLILELIFAGLTIVVAAHVNAVMQKD